MERIVSSFTESRRDAESVDQAKKVWGPLLSGAIKVTLSRTSLLKRVCLNWSRVSRTAVVSPEDDVV